MAGVLNSRGFFIPKRPVPGRWISPRSVDECDGISVLGKREICSWRAHNNCRRGSASTPAAVTRNDRISLSKFGGDCPCRDKNHYAYHKYNAAGTKCPISSIHHSFTASVSQCRGRSPHLHVFFYESLYTRLNRVNSLSRCMLQLFLFDIV